MTDVVQPKLPAWLERIRASIRPEWRETGYRLVAAVVMFLAAFGILDDQEAALWTQLGLSVVTAGFAALFATSGRRIALYMVAGPLGGLLMLYGIVTQERWALITAAAAQAFGIATAAAKTVQSPPSLP